MTTIKYVFVTAALFLMAIVIIIEIVQCVKEEKTMKHQNYFDPSPTAEGVQWLLIGISILLLMALGGN